MYPAGKAGQAGRGQGPVQPPAMPHDDPSNIENPFFASNWRLARPADIRRMAVVATCCFRDTEIFKRLYPEHKRYPSDTLRRYCQVFKGMMESNDHSVYVAERDYTAAEMRILPYPRQKLAKDVDPLKVTQKRVVAGVIIYKIPPGAPQIGAQGFRKQPGIYPRLAVNQDRDLDKAFLENVNEKAEEAQSQYLKGFVTLQFYAEHPSYKDNHRPLVTSSSLDQNTINGCKLAVGEPIKYGVLASPEQARLYERMTSNFVRVASIELDKFDHPKMCLHIFTWKRSETDLFGNPIGIP
ncbi:MAG: hypothetical protein M4579_000799 [Chaenotheca gracillima]|nr:MAG: hypothetical protein M4579_000799 [Chaenotheca gracillima]